MAIGHPLKVRLFLEGIEAPIISAQIQSQPNGPIMANIQVPPSTFVTKLLPRTVVHLFFLDFNEAVSSLVSYRGPKDAQTPERLDPTAYERAKANREKSGESVADFAADSDNVHYKLLFCGEVVGFNWTKTPLQRSVVLQCVDFSNYWDYAYQFNNTDLFGPGLKASFSGGSTNLLTDFLSTPGEVVASLLHQKSANYPALEGFLGGLIRMLESIGGSYFSENQFKGQNMFYSLAELRLHITQMITALPDDDTAKKLLNAHGYDGLFGRTLGNLGEQVSMRACLNALTAIIFHETYGIPTPLYVPGSKGSVNGYARRNIKDIAQYYPFYAKAVAGQSTIDDLKAALSDSPVTEPTADSLKRNTNTKAILMTRMTRLKQSLSEGRIQSEQKGLPSAVKPFSSAENFISRALGKIKKDWFPGVINTQKLASIFYDMDDAAKQLKTIESLEADGVAKSNAIPARLNMQIFKPDVWFAAPPRCNVLFPDQYMSVQYSRSFLEEPTRFLLKTNVEFYGEDELFDQFYFAPRARTVKAQKRSLQNLFNGDIMPHELFVGILPVFEKMGEMNIFAVRSGTVNGKQPKVSLAQRSANFLYFKHRLGSRQMSIHGMFNPYIAPGFPGLVIDKYMNPEQAMQLKELMDRMGSGVTTAGFQNAFLGNFTQVVHNVDQSQRQGQTEIQCSFPREYDESTEFSGLGNEEDQTVEQRFGDDVLRDTEVAAIEPPPRAAIGPNYGVISNVQETTDTHKNTDPGTAPKLPLWSGPRRSGSGELSTLVPVGVTQPASLYGDAVVSLVGDPNLQVKMRSFLISERVPRYRQTKVDLPVEELMRPGWYSDTWSNLKIGQAYQYYLRTGSITDKTQVADADGASTGQLDQDAIDGLLEGAQATSGDDPKGVAPALLTLDKDSSIQQSVQFILLTYSYIKQAGLNVDDFIRSYTWRPIATLVDMFGTSDLTYATEEVNGVTTPTSQVVAGIEGFHSKAFSAYTGIFDLVPPEVNAILDIHKNDAGAIMADVRSRRRLAVQDYVNSLQFARALLG